MYQIRLDNPSADVRAQLHQRLQAWVEEREGRLVCPDEDSSLLYVDGIAPSALEELRIWDGIVDICSEQDASFRASNLMPAKVEVGAAAFGQGLVSCLAGPCAVEEYDSMLALARGLAAAGATGLRGGAFKPRTSPYGFQGLGLPGLEILSAVGKASGLAVVTEVLDVRDLDQVAAHAQILQVGSRNMQNTPLLKEVGRVGLPVLLKRGMSATLDEFLYAAEYVALGGAPSVLLCERGLRHFDSAVRNLLDLSAVPALKARTGMPVIVDPSHGTGVAQYVPSMMLAAAAAGADGFLVEVHANPKASWSDAEQALPLQVFSDTLPSVAKVLQACGRKFHGMQPSSKV